MIKKENNFWKTSKLQHLIYKIILIILFTSSISYAELVKPNNGIEPSLVVQIQLRSLKENDNPKEEYDIKLPTEWDEHYRADKNMFWAYRKCYMFNEQKYFPQIKGTNFYTLILIFLFIII